MSYQATAYKYNQRGEVFVPNRTGTTYNIPSNHKNFIVYAGYDSDIEFFVIGSDRKPVDVNNITLNVKIIHRTSRVVALTKALQITSYEDGRALLKLTAVETSILGSALYDMVLTFTDSANRTFSMQSDQNNRIGYVLESKLNPAAGARTTVENTFFATSGNEYWGGDLASTTQSFNTIGNQNMVVSSTSYTGVLKVQATLAAIPQPADWLDVPNINDTLTSFTGDTLFQWTGRYAWVRLVHTPDSQNNTGTVDKVTYSN